MARLVIAIAVILGLAAAWWTSRRATHRGGPVATASLPTVGPRAADPSAGPAAASAAASAGSAPSARPVPPPRDPHPLVHPLVRDPRQPGYDAARLFGSRLDDARSLFDAEPRDGRWASAREADIENASLEAFRSVDPHARMEVECHTGSCRVRVFSKLPYLNNQMAPYPLMCLASFAQPEWGDATIADPYSDFYLMFGEATHGDEGFRARRESTCARYRDDWVREAPR